MAVSPTAIASRRADGEPERLVDPEQRLPADLQVFYRRKALF